jgi:single-strand DNA-binding protein
MLNKVILMGRLTKDPELRYTASNIPVCSITLAVNRRFTRQDEEKQTDFINIVFWNKTAEFVSKYYTKGIQVVVSGRLQSRNWEDKEGKKHYTLEVVADETHFTESKKNGGGSTEGLGGPSGSTGNFKNDNNDVDGFMPVDADDDLPF